MAASDWRSADRVRNGRDVLRRRASWAIRYPIRDFELADHRRDRLAVGARREGQRHAVLEDRLGEREHVVDRGREAAVEQRAGAHREHQRLAGARARAPGDQLADVAGVRAGTCRAHQREDRLDHRFADRQAAHQALRRHQVVRRHRGLRLGLLGAGGVEQDAPLGLAVRIVDVDLHQEAVELGFGQRIGAFLLQRILRRQHVERARQIVARAGDRDMMLLHRLQQRRLGARAGAVDLVGHQQLGEHRARDEAEIALAAGALLQHLGAENVGRHQVRA